MFFAVILPVAVLALGILRLATSHGNRQATLLGWGLVFTGGAKALRIPVLSDEWADTYLHALTGVWNVTDFSGMFLGVCAAIFYATFTAEVVGQPFQKWLAPAGIALAGALMATAFLSSPVSGQPTAYMSADFPMTGWFAAYWAVYLVGLGGSSLMISLFVFWAIRRFRPSPLRTAIGLFGLAAALFVVYTLHKLIDIASQTVSWLAWYNQISPQISMGLLLASFGCVVVCAAVGAWPYMRAWGRRWRLLSGRHEQWRRIADTAGSVVLDRTLIPENPTRLRLLVAARDPVATHRMMVEMVDAKPASEVVGG